MSRTLSGLFLVGALNRLRKRKRTIRENPRTIPAQIGKIPEKSGKSEKGQKRTKKEGQAQIGKPPRLKPPHLAALDQGFIPQPEARFVHSHIHLATIGERFTHSSQRPRRLLLSLEVPSRSSPGSGPGPSRSHPGSEAVPSRFAMCFALQRFGPVQIPRWGPSRPVLVPSWSQAFGTSFQDRSEPFAIGPVQFS